MDSRTTRYKQRLKSLKKRLKANSRHNTKTGCLEWTGARTQGGYGQIGTEIESDISVGKRRTSTSTHRASHLVHKGKIPPGKQVCHMCDNPRCINPKHLFVGTPYQNMQDAKAKGRLVGSRISVQSRKKIKQEYVAAPYGYKATTANQLAVWYRVSTSTIRTIAAES